MPSEGGKNEEEEKKKEDWLIPDAIPEQRGLDEWDPRIPGDVDNSTGQ